MHSLILPSFAWVSIGTRNQHETTTNILRLHELAYLKKLNINVIFLSFPTTWNSSGVLFSKHHFWDPWDVPILRHTLLEGLRYI